MMRKGGAKGSKRRAPTELENTPSAIYISGPCLVWLPHCVVSLFRREIGPDV